MEKLEEASGAEQEQLLTEAIDWRGRPATAKHGGPKTSFFILINQGLWNVAVLAVATNLVLYFRGVLGMSNAVAANNVTNWFGTTWLLTLLGGFLGDSYLGRFWTCVLFQLVHVAGLVLLGLSATLDSLKPQFITAAGAAPSAGHLQVAVFYVAIYIVALGTGGILPAFLALGADQYDSAEQRTSFFGWNFFFTNIGSVIANTVIVYLENEGHWAMGYWLAAGTGVLAMLVFAAGIPTYRQFRPGKNPFTRVAQVVAAAGRKWKVQVPDNAGKLHEATDKEILRQGSRKLAHTPGLTFLDKAATKVDDEEDAKLTAFASSPWKLCSVTHVEEIKCLLRMMPIWLTAIPYSAVFSQINTLFIEQAVMMDTRLVPGSRSGGVGSFHVPPASMSVLNVVSIFVTTAAYPWTVVPLARLVTRRKEGMTSLQRLGVGQVATAAAMAVAAAVESRRLKMAAAGVQMSVWWLAPQEIILGASQVLAVVGAMDFFYSEAPHSMRGIVSSLSLANLAVGSYVSTLLVSATMHFTSGGGRPGWIPPDLNQGHVDYFYCILLFITLLNTAFFALIAIRYRRSCPLPAAALLKDKDNVNTK